MTSLSQDIKDKLKRLNVLEKIIAVNIAVFLLGFLFKSLVNWFELPSDLNTFIVQPWSIITYAFVHYNFLHILFNMLWLYIIAQWVLNLFNPKIALNIYFLGAISGAVLYLLLYNLSLQKHHHKILYFLHLLIHELSRFHIHILEICV